MFSVAGLVGDIVKIALGIWCLIIDRRRDYLIPKTQPPHVGSSSEYREDVLNLAFPRAVKGYDKLGNKLLLKTFKHYWFGGKAFTKAKVEAFFDNPDNFVSF